MSTATPTPLAYGRRRRGRRFVGFGLLLTLLATGGLAHHWRARWLPPLRHRWDLYQLTRSQARCMAFTPSPGQVVYTDAAAAAVGPDARRITAANGSFVVWQPAAWRDFLARADAEDVTTAQFVDLHSPAEPAPSSAVPPVWLHRRVLVDGSRELTCVVVLDADPGFVIVQGISWTEGTTATPPRFSQASWSGDPLCINKALVTDPLTIYAAEQDERDADGITIPYRVGRRSGVIRAHLAGHTIRFTPDAGWFDDRNGHSDWMIDGGSAPLRTGPLPAFTLPYPPGRDAWKDRPMAMAFSADGRRVRVVMSDPPRVLGWDVPTRRLCETIALSDPGRTATGSLWRVALSPDAQLCATEFGDGAGQVNTIRCLDLATDREIGRTEADACLLGLSRDGRTAYVDEGDRLTAFDAHTWKARASATMPGRIASWAIGRARLAVCISNSADRLEPGRFSIVLTTDALAVVTAAGPPFGFSAVMSPDDNHLFEFHRDNQLPLNRPPNGLYETDLIAGAVRRCPAGGDGGPLFWPNLDSSAFSADGRWWAASDCGSVGIVWAYPGLSEIWKLTAPDAPEDYALAFSPDSRWLATGARTGVAVWPLPSANPATAKPPAAALPPPAGGR